MAGDIGKCQKKSAYKSEHLDNKYTLLELTIRRDRKSVPISLEETESIKNSIKENPSFSYLTD